MELARRRDLGWAVARGIALASAAAGGLLDSLVEASAQARASESEGTRYRRELALARARRVRAAHRRCRRAVSTGDWSAASTAADELAATAVELGVDERGWRKLVTGVGAALDTGLGYHCDDDDPALRGLERCLGYPRERWPALRAAIDEGERRARLALAELVEANLRLVHAIARRYVHSSAQPLSDLVQEGNLGLMRAAEKFDHHHGTRFSTYATWWIRQSITRSIADKGRTIRLPVHVVETLHKLNRIRREHFARAGVEPLPEELAARLGLGLARVNALLSLGGEPIPLDTPISEDAALSDVIEDPSALDLVDHVASLEQSGQVRQLLAGLDERERRVLRLRFGFEPAGEQTLEAVADEFALTRERIRQIEAKALQKLRRPLIAAQRI